MFDEGERKFSLLLWLCIKLIVIAQLLHSQMPLKRLLIGNFWNTSAVGVWQMSWNEYCCSHKRCSRPQPTRASVHHPVAGNLASLSLQGSLILYTTNAKINGIILINLNFHDNVWSNSISMPADPSSYHSYDVFILFSNFSKEGESHFLPESVVLSYAFFFNDLIQQFLNEL